MTAQRATDHKRRATNFSSDVCAHSFFDLFALPAVFNLDSRSLERAYRVVQSRVHPDKFAASGGAEQRQAAQWAALANEAYQTLKHPLQRASYLLRLNGIDPGVHTAPVAFLATQLELREAVQDAKRTRNLQALAELQRSLRRDISALHKTVARQLDAARDYAGAAQTVQMLQFLDKLATEINAALDALEN